MVRCRIFGQPERPAGYGGVVPAVAKSTICSICMGLFQVWVGKNVLESMFDKTNIARRLLAFCQKY